ncbi:MAG TPA: FeoA family protein [Acidobacteriota bacterium]|nr:FeoA family protein [Acidobacteriota bacterium]HRR25745.1 FeoA family protein [Acidobacteriota bacterium]HRV07860.1 FeoA family protein [Acidobacteriota bacterium]
METCNGQIIPLTHLKLGIPAKVVSVNRDVAERLSGFGVYPGARIEVHQKYPSFVIRVDEIELALEAKVAQTVRVRPLR